MATRSRRARRKRTRWTLPATAALLILAGWCRPAPAAEDAANAEIGLLWQAVDASLAAKQDALALELVAELSLIPSERGRALHVAGLVYLRRGDRSQAEALLEQAASEPGQTESAEALIALYAQQARWKELQRIAQLVPWARWSDQAAMLIALAHQQLGEQAPKLENQRPEPGLHLIGGLTYHANADSPYRDDVAIRDDEFSADCFVEGQWPTGDQWEWELKLAASEAWSEETPESFGRYRVRRLILTGGASWQPTPDWTLHLAGGPAWSRNVHGDTADSPDDACHATAEVTRIFGPWKVRGRWQQTSFLDPRGNRVDVAVMRTADASLSWTPQPWIRCEAEAGRHDFDRSFEGYEFARGRLLADLTGPLRPRLRAALYHEFREQPETIATLGAEVTPLSKHPQWTVGTLFDLNCDTGERECTVMINGALRPGASRLRLYCGALLRQELAVSDDRLMLIYLSFVR